MVENYCEGDLGTIFRHAEPVSYPSVYKYLQQIGVMSGTNGEAKQMIDACMGELKWMQDACASESCLKDLSQHQLTLRADTETPNTALDNIVTDDEGNIISYGRTEEKVKELRKEYMMKFEVVQLGTLVPKSVDECLTLIPSLSRFEEEDLKSIIGILNKVL